MREQPRRRAPLCRGRRCLYAGPRSRPLPARRRRPAAFHCLRVPRARQGQEMLTRQPSSTKLDILSAEWLEMLLSFDFTVAHLPDLLNYPSGPFVLDMPPPNPSAHAPRVGPRHHAGRNDHQRQGGRHSHSRGDQEELICQYHEAAGHFGVTAIVNKLHSNNLRWPTMVADILAQILLCRPCLDYNAAKTRFHPLRSLHTFLPLDHVVFDLAQFTTSPDGNNYTNLFPPGEFGVPKVVQPDSGGEFANEVMHMMVNLLHIKH
ncbi:MAG: hypothetical protein BJ554DRAFT_8385 [Olpidium bornovanus]|uniref:Integrase zinc-binding domain-containing protein n=1 Tax=Olpidium bornovanus TaxID=278681 RepID=A0A8H8DIN1_9FUNG|nr:MAG: hypothetical protein BJ554DRAFT_8385 [Olpidium bornovanus]